MVKLFENCWSKAFYSTDVGVCRKPRRFTEQKIPSRIFSSIQLFFHCICRTARSDIHKDYGQQVKWKYVNTYPITTWTSSPGDS